LQNEFQGEHMVGKSQASGSYTLQHARPDQSECLKF
jgi:hypothetical protein